MPLPETPPLPGPGQYDLKGQIDGEKHYMTHAAFVSSSSRWNSQAKNPDFPGPGKINKTLFIYPFHYPVQSDRS